MKSRWFIKLMVVALIIALLPVLVVSAANGPGHQPPARERPATAWQRAQPAVTADAVSPDDDDPGSAIYMGCGSVYNGEIDVPGDVDYYYVDVPPGQMFAGFINAFEYGSTLDSVLTLYESDGVTEITTVDDFDDYDPLIHHTDVNGGGVYYFKVEGFGTTTGWYTLTTDVRYYFTTKQNGTVDGINYQAGDVLVYNACAGYWEMFIDASDLGMKRIADVAIVPDTDGIIFSLPNQNTIFGPVSANDVYAMFMYDVGWDTAAYGFTTLLDGSDVGLSGGREQVDGVMVTPWKTLAISVNGNGNVPGLGGFADEDLVELTSATLGEDSSGDWAMLFDTSDTGAGPIDTHGIWMNNFWYDVYTVSDKKTDFGWGKTSVGVCYPLSLGLNTSCDYYVEAFNGPMAGMPANVNLRGFDMGTDFLPDGFLTLTANAPERGK